jgi:iron complex transport system ATP-binding protein
LAQRAEILLLDEPTNHLDLKHQWIVLELLKKLSRDENLGILIVCHDLIMAKKYADRVLLLREGQIISEGKPDQCLIPEIISDVFNLNFSEAAQQMITNLLDK